MLRCMIHSSPRLACLLSLRSRSSTPPASARRRWLECIQETKGFCRKIVDHSWYFGWDYPITIPFLSLASHVNPLILYGIDCIIQKSAEPLQPVPQGMSPFPSTSSWHLPRCPLSVSAPSQWRAFSTPQKRSDLKESFSSVAARDKTVGSLHLAGRVWCFIRCWNRENMKTKLVGGFNPPEKY